MTTLGDVWAITAIIVGVATCAWALLLCLALLFQSRSRIAMEKIEGSPWRALLSGLLLTVLWGGLGVVLIANPLPPVKLVGWGLTLSLMAISFTGTAGLVLLAARRLREIDPGLSSYGAFSRAAVFIVLPSILPLFGWFLFAPLIFSIGVGAGMSALRHKEVLVSPSLS